MINFLDLKGINGRFELEFQKKFKQFLSTGQYILGSGVEPFEKNYANYCGTKYCIGVSNGLDALILIFKAYIHLGNLQKGDEVIVPSNTYIATILAVIEVGLKPVFVEPNIETFNGEALEIKLHISKKTKAILIVHLYGQLANMECIQQLSKAHDLLLIEDAAQAHGALLNNSIRVGNLSNAAAISFYPSKNLGVLGDAGAVTTNDEKLATTIKQLRNYGTSSKYENTIIGVNNRLDKVQALFLNTKLKFLDADNKKRREVAKKYLKKIKNTKIKLPFYDGSQNHVFHLFVILVDNRKHFIQFLRDNDIESSIHYSISTHKQKALEEFSGLDLPTTEYIHDHCVSLPISPVISREDVLKVINVINTY